MEKHFKTFYQMAAEDYVDPKHWKALKMQISGLCLRLTESESLGLIPEMCVFNKVILM